MDVVSKHTSSLHWSTTSPPVEDDWPWSSPSTYTGNPYSANAAIAGRMGGESWHQANPHPDRLDCKLSPHKPHFPLTISANSEAIPGSQIGYGVAVTSVTLNLLSNSPARGSTPRIRDHLLLFFFCIFSTVGVVLWVGLRTKGSVQPLFLMNLLHACSPEPAGHSVKFWGHPIG